MKAPMDIIKYPDKAVLNGARGPGPRPAPTLAQIEQARVPPRARAAPVRGAPVWIDLDALQQRGQLVPQSHRSVLSESFRRIKRPLLLNAQGHRNSPQRGALIMVTSALPGEGKTFFATNLAMSVAAEIDTSVLLIEADVLRPNLLNRLGVQADIGLLDVLMRRDLDAADVVLPTNVPKLSLMAAGTAHPHATEMLASSAMESLLASLLAADPNRIVILDVPPLLVTSEAQVLASRVGQVVVVVEASRTPSHSVAQAFAMLEDVPIVMSVLNRVPESTLAHRYPGHHGHLV